MKFKLGYWEKLSIRIIILFVIAIFSTFVPEYLHTFFGDWYCNGSGARDASTWAYAGCNYGESGFHGPTCHWGYRHWLWAAMCSVLFILNAIRISKFKENI